MKQALATITAILFAGSVQAASDFEVYHGFAVGNSDLSTEVGTMRHRLSDPRLGFDALVYNGFEQGNPELSTDGPIAPAREVAMTGAQPAIGSAVGGFGTDSGLFAQGSIYNGFEEGNPDL